MMYLFSYVVRYHVKNGVGESYDGDKDGPSTSNNNFEQDDGKLQTLIYKKWM